MLAKSIIDPAQTEWAATIVFVSKKNGILRFCEDYRKLKPVTKRDSFFIPRIDAFIDSLDTTAVFSTLDVSSSY